MFSRCFGVLLILLVWCSPSGRGLPPPLPRAGTTFYVDWVAGNDGNDGLSPGSAWKRGPGMRGFAGRYAHAAGNRFVFKGGVVWPAEALPLRLMSGEAEKVVSYTTDRSWFAGAEWSRPVLDGGGVGTRLMEGNAVRHVRVHELELRNVETPGSAVQSYGVYLENCAELELSNNRIQPFCWRGVVLVGYDGTTQGNLVIRDNELSDSAVPLTVAAAGRGTRIEGVEISGNRFRDLSSMMVYDVHGDGVQVFTSEAPGEQTQAVSGRIHGNTFSGRVGRSSATGAAGMTAWIYLASNNGDFAVFNNVLSYSDETGEQNYFKALINVADNARGSTQIYNNTLVGADPGMSAAIVLERTVNVTVMNNILTGMRNCYDVDRVPGFASDFNLLDTTYGESWMGKLNGQFVSTSQWKALGFDRHSRMADPQLVPEDEWRLETGSPAIGMGANVEDVFAVDRDGRVRREPWDVGAYVAPEFVGRLWTDAVENGELVVSWELPRLGNEYDWIALVDVMDRSRWVGWKYTNGEVRGSLRFLAPARAGLYQFVYFAHGVESRVKPSHPVAISPAPIASPEGYAVSAQPTGAGNGRRIVVEWVAPEAANRFDWIGLYRAGDRSELLEWKYTNGTRRGAATFAWPGGTGTYELTYFLNGTYRGMATSSPITMETSAEE